MDIDSQDRNTRGWLILGLLLLVLLVLLCTCNHSRGIENRLQVDGEAVLTETGLEPSLLTVGGRDAFLAGEVSSIEARQEAEQILGTVPGIRKVFNNLTVLEPVVDTPEPEPTVDLRDPSLNLCINDCVVTLEGLLAQDASNEIINAANSLCGAENVSSTLTVAEDVAAAPWLSGFINLLPRFNDDLSDACLNAGVGTLSISGKVASEDLKAELASLAASNVELAITDGLELVAAELIDPNLNFKLADNKIELRGLVPESSIAPTVAAASQIVGDENVINNLTAEDNVAAPEWFARVIDRLPVFANAVQTPELDIASNTVTLRGIVASEEEKTQFGNDFTDAAGVGVAVVNDLQVIAPQLDAALNIKMADTGVELEGVLPQALADTLTTSTQLINPNLTNNLVAEAGVTNPDWLAAVIDRVPDLAANAQDAELDVSGNILRLEGLVASEALRTQLADDFRAAAGDNVSIINNLRVLEPVAQPQFNIQLKDDGTVEVRGNLTAEAANALTEVASDVSDQVTSNLAEVPSVATPEWLGRVIGQIPSFNAQVSEAELDVQDATITLTGTVESEEAKAAVAAEIAQAAGEGIEVVNNLEVAMSQLEPAFTVKLNDDGSVELTGNVAAETATSLNQTAEQLSDSLTTNLAATENIAAPNWFDGVISRIPDFNAQVADAELDVTGETLTLNGVVATEEQKAAIEAEFVAATGPGVSVQNNLRVEAIETAADTPVEGLEPEFSVQLNDDGSVAISGNLNPEAANTLTETAAGDASDVTTNLAETPEISNPEWLNQVIDRIPDFNAQVDSAALDVKGSTITLTGTVATEEAKAAVAADIAQAAGEGVEVLNQLQVIAPQPEIETRLSIKLKDDGSVELSGDVAPEIATSVTEMASKTADSVTNDLAVGPTVAAPEWLPSVINQIPDFNARVADAEVNVEGNTVSLNGVVGSEEEKAQIAARFVDVTGPGVSIINNLQVIQPDLVAPSLNVQISDGTLKLRGQVAESTANLVTDTANQVAETVESSLASSSRVASPDWLTRVIDKLPEFAGTASQAELDISESSLTLTGIVPSEEVKIATEASFVEAAGPGVTVINNLRVVEPQVDVIAAPEVSEPNVAEAEVAEPVASEPVAVSQPDVTQAALTSPSIRIDCAADTVRLTGSVASEENKQLAASVFVDKTTENLLEVSADKASPDYLSNVLGIALRVCNDLGRASLQLENDSLTLSGVTLSNEQRDAIASYAGDALSPDINIVNRLTVESLVPVSEDGK